MTLSRISLALALVMVVVLLAAGCAGQTGDGNSAGNSTPATTMPTSNLTSPEKNNSIPAEDLSAALRSYRQNLTASRKKSRKISSCLQTQVIRKTE